MQQVWRKRWRNTGWIILAAVTLVLLVSAVHKKNHKPCSSIEVAFDGDGNNFFVDEKGVIGVLKTYSPLKGEPIESINLEALETRLKNDRWIANAELFFDNKQVLQVLVEEKKPVARIFTVEGNSFYIDSACKRLPLSDKLSARIPMFTSFPSDRAQLSKPDSELMASVKDVAMFIQADDFWRAQVAQIDITPDGFEMIPTVGNHVVELGKDGDWQQKFDRLFSFYKQVWTKVGFEKYEKVDVQFDGQVVATLKGVKSSKVDSTQLRIAYENLLTEMKKSDEDSTSADAGKLAVIKLKKQEVTDEAVTNKERETKPVKKQNSAKALPVKELVRMEPAKLIAKQTAMKKDILEPHIKYETAKQQESNIQSGNRVPKAVMRKKII